VSGLEVVDLTDGLEAAYEDFLHKLDHGLFYYSAAYRRFLVELLGCSAPYRLAVRGGEIVGVLPLMAVDGRYGRVWNSLPFFGSHGGVLALDAGAAAGLYEAYAGLLEASEVVAATVIGNPWAPSDEAQLAFDLCDERVGQATDLGPLAGSLPDQFWAATDSSARRNIRKAQGSGVRVRTDSSAVGFLADCHEQNMSAVGGKAKNRRFFDLLRSHFTPGEDYNVYVAEVENVRIAALLLFYYNRTVEYFVPATTAGSRSLQPMALIVATAMADAARIGYRRWNWGGTWLNQDGVYRFKRKWNATERPYRYYTRVIDRSLLSLRREELTTAYEDFYVLPFGALAGAH
jgi:hypothetical protein